MTALYLERYLNFGLTLDELRNSGKPIIGIAQTGSDLSPCNRHHLELASRLRDGIRDAGGIPMEFPVHPIQETGKRPTAALDRNLSYLGLVELLYGYPLDGVVLTTGCDKTTPAMLMGVREDLRPSQIMTRAAFDNAIVAASALGASTNCPPHVTAIARHMGVDLPIEDWDRIGYEIPLLVNLMPAGEYLGEEFHRAGGVPAVLAQLLAAGKLHGDVRTVSGKTMAEDLAKAAIKDDRVIKTYAAPMLPQSGFAVLRGNLFDAAVMKTSVISEAFRQRYLQNPADPDAFEGRAIVFEGPEDYHERINDPSLAIDADCILFIRGTGPVGYPGAAEVVNMLPPDELVKQGITLLPCVGDGRQSGTSASPSILNASPEAAVGGGLALLHTGDRVRIDLAKRRADMLISDAELAARRAAWKPPELEHQTPWQELQRAKIGQLSSGACLDFAVKYQRIAVTKGIPRDNH
ncbi:MAG: hypothetical protein EBW73_07540 [Betaproteobacteria bacterium]|nr:hypothetical protein [Betaproteobacteria bacterium]